MSAVATIRTVVIARGRLGQLRSGPPTGSIACRAWTEPSMPTIGRLIRAGSARKTSTEHGAALTTFRETLPSSSPPTRS